MVTNKRKPKLSTNRETTNINQWRGRTSSKKQHKSTLNLVAFSERRTLWVGKSSKNKILERERRENQIIAIIRRKNTRLAVHSLCNYFSENDINNCNRLYWEKKGSSLNVSIWNITREISITLSREEKDILRKLDEIEERDKE